MLSTHWAVNPLGFISPKMGCRFLLGGEKALLLQTSWFPQSLLRQIMMMILILFLPHPSDCQPLLCISNNTHLQTSEIEGMTDVYNYMEP